MRTDPFVRHFVRRTVRREFAGCSPCKALHHNTLRRHANKRTPKRAHTFFRRTVRIEFARTGVASGIDARGYEDGEQTNAKTRTPPHTPQGRALAQRRRALGWKRVCKGSSHGSSLAQTRREARGNSRNRNHSLYESDFFLKGVSMNTNVREPLDGHMRRLGKGGFASPRPPSHGLLQPHDPGQPLGPGGALHDSGVVDPAKPAADEPQETPNASHNVEGVCQQGGPGSELSTSPIEPGGVDEVGREAGNPRDALHTETEAASSIRRLRYVDAVRLLNSTPLGRVVNDRQIRRHRARSKEAFCQDGRVDLVAYAAWLIQTLAKETDRSTGSVSVKAVLDLIERQNFRCALTGRTLEPQTASLDHIIPLTQNGQHVIENTQVLHKDVNRAKGTLTNDVFLALCREVVAWADSNGREGGHV